MPPIEDPANIADKFYLSAFPSAARSGHDGYDYDG
jgi:hypothetical protein